MKELRRKNLFIASEVRSGSTYIAESISYSFNRYFDFQFWGLTQEKFSHITPHTDPDEITTLCKSLFLDKSGFSSAKIMCKELSILYRHAQLDSSLRDCFFGKDSYWIVVRRKDRIAQAVSLAMARKSGLYHFYGDPSEAPDNLINADMGDINSALGAISLSDVYLSVFLDNLRPANSLAIFYEDFMKKEINHLNRIAKLCDFGTIDKSSFVNESKLTRTSQNNKLKLKSSYSDWLLKNYI